MRRVDTYTSTTTLVHILKAIFCGFEPFHKLILLLYL